MVAILTCLSLFAAIVTGADALKLNVSTAGARRPNLRAPSSTSNQSRGGGSSKTAVAVQRPLPAENAAHAHLPVHGSSQNLSRSSSNVSTVEARQPPSSPAGSRRASTKAEAPARTTAAPAMLAVDAADQTDADKQVSAVAQLRQEVQEVKQHRTNIAQMQQALSAEVALLRESAAMERASVTRRDRAAAQAQLRKAEQLVKTLSGMLRASRTSAIEDAKAMLSEATEVRVAADALASEASAQLRALAPGSGHHSRRQEAAVKPAEAAENTAEQSELVVSPLATSPPAQAAPAAKAAEADATALDSDDSDADADDA